MRGSLSVIPKAALFNLAPVGTFRPRGKLDLNRRQERSVFKSRLWVDTGFGYGGIDRKLAGNLARAVRGGA